MSHKAVSNDPLMLKYCLDSYEIQELLWNQKKCFCLTSMIKYISQKWIW